MLRGLLVAGAVVGGLLVAVDRGTARIAEDRVAERIQRDQQLGAPPEVDVHGFPFLTQAARRRFDLVTMHADDVRRTPLRFARVDARLSRVEIEGVESARVATADVTALLRYADLSAVLPHRLALSEERGRLRLRAAVRVLGRTYVASATGMVQVRRGDLLISPTGIRLEPGLPAIGIPRSVVAQLTVRQRVTLPFGLRLAAVQVRPDGLHVAGTGTGLQLNPAVPLAVP